MARPHPIVILRNHPDHNFQLRGRANQMAGKHLKETGCNDLETGAWVQRDVDLRCLEPITD